MAGLLAARVLSDHFRSVTIIERDALPDSLDPRRGVPQGRHVHGLLAGGRQVIERLFPGFTQDMICAGAPFGDIAGDVRWFNEGNYLARFNSGMTVLSLTRPFLEAGVRRRVRAIRNVTLRENCEIKGLATSENRRRVVGVKIGEVTFPADLVVDASGRASYAPRWLEALGFEKPPEERVEIALGYSSRFFRRRPADLNGDLGVVVTPSPLGKRGGVMAVQEGDRWMVTLTGHFGNYAPTDLAGFVEIARSLPTPDIYNVIRTAEPLGEPVSARFPASMRHRYEMLLQFPEGFLVIGDAISSFNPVYGQGMSAAALEAIELGAILASGSRNLAKRFFTRAAKVVDTPWSIAVGNDLRMPETVGPRGRATRLINWYMEKLNRAAHHDPIPALAFHRVANLIAPPPSAFHPRVALRVFLGNLRPTPKPEFAPPSLQAAAGR